MNSHLKLKSLMAGTALTMTIAGMAAAQTLNVDTAELEGKSAECQALGQFILEQDGSIEGADPQRVATAVNDDIAQECADIQAVLSGDAQATDSDQATETESETETETDATTATVDTTQEATITGEAQVRIPEPNVDVRVPQPEVTVTRSQPQVSVQEGASQIDVEQGQPEISVEIPTINVRVTMPAPRIYVLESDPEVSVTEADPQVEVVQGEPEVTVTQAEPELEIDLGVGDGETAPDETQEQADAGGVEDVSGDVEIAEQRPVVNFVTSQEPPQIEFTRADPEISFAGAEPNVTISMAEQPSVEVQVDGDPEIVIETTEEREQRQAGQQAEDGQAQDEGQSEEAPEQAAAGDGTTMTVGDLMGMDVMTAGGENLGNPEAVIDVDGQQYLLLSSGGFLDIGDKIVPVPMGNVSVADGNLTLAEMTEADVERARDYEYDENAALADDQPVMLTP
ncbi:PRC-barrel domain-containing protein [Paracoccus tegillarcae]|uniref:PRC-barrel domain-containing protein n=1 Tax=Paracoccus tegillarcae TaxID=1529068 RepID=A0A2K9EQB2_9RHOB|nr:PRC-barrel domain-containing protein [Paracoccus tegillarcae]AUH32926.1 hypothetical protein CUV01_05535 [Paracoccus tegillarcae]